jgi:hypothetical protein
MDLWKNIFRNKESRKKKKKLNTLPKYYFI